MTSVNAVAWVPVVAVLALWVYCLVDFTRTDDSQLGLFSRQVWLLLLVFTSLFGCLLWLAYGRPARASGRRR